MKILTAVLLIRCAVVVAVVDAIANVVLGDTAAVVAAELCIEVAGSEETTHFIAIVSTVIIMVTAVVVRNTSPISTGEHCRLTGVEGWWTETRQNKSEMWQTDTAI